MTISEKILTLRKKEGYSQEDLAEKLDVSRQAVYKWETGAASPEVDKIKMIAKLFDVSFDYLLNDEMEEPEQPAPPQKKTVKYRKVFCVGDKLDPHQVDIEIGYAPGKRRKLQGEAYEGICLQASVKTLEMLECTKKIDIQPGTSTTFFYMEKEKAFGFYYGGRVQIICPIEDLLGFEFGKDGDLSVRGRQVVTGVGFGNGGVNSFGVGSIPTTNTIPSTEAWAVLSYRDGEEIKELKMEFSVNNYRVCERAANIQQQEFLWSVELDGLMKKLQSVQMTLHALLQVAADIRDGNATVEEIDYTAIRQRNEETGKAYRAYLERITADGQKAEKQHLLGVVLGWTFGIAAAILIIVLIAKNMGF